ncbi:MAG: exo-alpha-sialidase [Verrucomicrobia bacterium]|nr:exo-alpha-sialidase [Verrucomicrobiota bacterium]
MKKFKWSYLLVAPLVIFAFVLLSRARSEARFEAGPIGQLKQAAGDVRYAKLLPSGERLEGGLYDPSIAYAPDGSVGWLAYSSVTGDHKPIGEYVHTHLARTTNGGASWQFVKVLNPSTNSTLTLPDGKSLPGLWRYEVPTLLHDAADPDATRRWKLFVHCYFTLPNGRRMVPYGWIALRTAADPAGEWSTNAPLFGAGKSPPAPYNKTLVDVNALDASLKNIVAYSEPGAFAHDGRLYLSMTALKPRLGLGGIGVSHTIFLIGSDDHGKSWRFISTLLTPDDAKGLGCEFFDGSSLAEEDGRFFLFAAPMLRNKNEVHHGTAAFEFASLGEGQLKRDEKQQLVVAAYFAPQPGIFSGPGAGQATYDSRNTNGGLIMPQFNLKAYPEAFQIYQTGRRIVPKKS